MKRIIFGLFLFLILTDISAASPQGSHYNWTKRGLCGQYTPSGILITIVDANFCRRAVGSYYSWSRMGMCCEYTPTGILIDFVDESYCQQHSRNLKRFYWPDR